MNSAQSDNAQKRETGLVVAAARSAASMLDPDPAHSECVAGLSLSLFDLLSGLHGMGPHERTLLHAAALLHDVGWSASGEGGHHKRSARMIRGMDIGLTGKDLEICALVARFHTKAEPDPDRHERFGSLCAEHRRAVEWLAGILRVCDGLDCSHAGRVMEISCSVSADSVVLTALPRGPAAEVSRSAHKSGLLEKAIGRQLVIE